MSLLILFFTAFVFFFVFVCIVITDNQKKKKGQILKRRAKAAGIGLFFISFSMTVFTVYHIIHFDGRDYGEKRVLLKTTLQAEEVVLPAHSAKKDQSLLDGMDQVKEKIDSREKGTAALYFTDALKRKRTVPIYRIHSYTEDFSLEEGTVQLKEYLVTAKDGQFTLPQIYWELSIGAQTN